MINVQIAYSELPWPAEDDDSETEPHLTVKRVMLDNRYRGDDATNDDRG